MTQQPQQLKFGDRVRYKDNENPVFGVVLEEANPGNGLITVQFIDDAEPELVGSEDLEYVPHPDTVRLDWLIKRNFDFQKCYDMGGRWWYEDNSFDEIEGTEGMTEREAIDKVMEKEAEK
jgi:hypothetical protein